MGLFSRKTTPPPAQGSNIPPLGSGRKLRSDLSIAESLSVLDDLITGYRPPKYKHSPTYVYAGWRWNDSSGPAPTTVVSFEDDDKEFFLAAFWSKNSGTEFGLFPLGSGDERLQTVPIIGEWKQKDRSLTSIGKFPNGVITLKAPAIQENFFTDILRLAGFPATPDNVEAVGRKIGEMFLIKAHQFISSQDPRAAEYFMQSHTYAGGSLIEFCQSVLDDIVGWNFEVVPYIQDLPMRCRAILLNIDKIDDDAFWSKLTR